MISRSPGPMACAQQVVSLQGDAEIATAGLAEQALKARRLPRLTHLYPQFTISVTTDVASRLLSAACASRQLPHYARVALCFFFSQRPTVRAGVRAPYRRWCLSSSRSVRTCYASCLKATLRRGSPPRFAGLQRNRCGPAIARVPDAVLRSTLGTLVPA